MIILVISEIEVDTGGKELKRGNFVSTKINLVLVYLLTNSTFTGIMLVTGFLTWLK